MEETAALSAAQALEELRTSYQAFTGRLERSKASSVGEVMGNFFRSQGNPRVTYAVEEFNQLLTGQVAALAELLAECPAEAADDLAGQALEQMLFYPPPADRAAALPLAAFEGHAIPLLPFLAPQRRRELSRRYLKRNPARAMLPKQRQLWRALSLD